MPVQMRGVSQQAMETQLPRTWQRQQTAMDSALQRAMMRKGVERKALRRKEGRRQRYQITMSPHMMASLPAAEGLVMALGCAPATAERCASWRSGCPAAVLCHQHRQHAALLWGT